MTTWPDETVDDMRNNMTRRPRRWACFVLLCAALGAGLSACGMASSLTRAEPTPTAVPVAMLEIVADRSLNPDINGLPKPLLLRVYELRAGATFERASYLDLQDKDETQLGGDFVRREEFLIAPGGRRVLELKGNPDVRALGLLAGFRNLERSTWRAVIDAPNAVEMRRRWWGLGPTAQTAPVRYLVTLSRDTVHIQLQSNTR
jgi:type VI secretion system protein VasD